MKAATTNSLSYVWIFYTAVTFAGLLGALGIKKNELSKTLEEHKTGLHTEIEKAKEGT